MNYKAAAVAVVAVLASSSAVMVADRSSTTLPPTQRPTAEQVPPGKAALACPAPPSGADTVNSVFAVSPTAGNGQRPAVGALDLARLQRPPRPTLSSMTMAGEPLQRALEPDTGGLLVAASGGLARGVSAVVSSVLASTKTSGLAASACGAASNDWWFSAVDTSVGATSRLVLSNPTRAVAVVDLALFGYKGPIEPAGARGITVAPYSQRILDLSRFAPGSDALTVNAHASRGSVVAAVLTTKRRRVEVAGSEWVSPGAGPTTNLVINPAPPPDGDAPRGDRDPPGGAATVPPDAVPPDAVPPDAGKQRLVLTNTSGRQALAHVRVFDASGTFTPTRLTDVRINPGSVVVEHLLPITRGEAAGVRVSSNVPVTGAVTTITSAKTEDFTVSGSAEPITAPAVVPLLPDSDLSLLLTTPDPVGGSLRVQTFDHAGSRVRNQVVTVKGAAVTVWEPPEAGRAAYLVVSMRSGESISGIATYRSADGIASLPVLSGVWSIVRPAVMPVP